MHTDHQPPKTGCAGCHLPDCPAEVQPDESALAGWRLAAASAGLFLGPIFLAIVGSAVAGHSHEARFLGGLAGLILGMAVSVAVARLLGRRNDRAA